jgi:oxygen-independent coproporphyrinogen-3 oxidase
MGGIYLHIPFCKQACHYCDFHFSVHTEETGLLVKAIIKELELQKEYLNGENIHTIYFGGGTPSLLREEELEEILHSIHTFYPVAKYPEITLEANPDDLSIQKLENLKLAGINRLSLGIQTFNDTLLTYLNRAHNSATARTSFRRARDTGFANISIDLIYSIPGQDQAGWAYDIDQALELNPDHISSYSLTIEARTVFGHWAKTGRLQPVEDDLAAAQLEFLMQRLESSGYEQYEVSNFAKPGFYSRHNSNYWRQENYLGIGPGAHSYNGVSRQFNVRNNPLYVKSVEAGRVPAEMENLTTNDRINEYLLTTLRTSWGCNVEFIRTQFNYDLLQENAAYIKQLLDQKMITLNNHTILLTRMGKLMADKIASDLFVLA